MKGTYKTRIDKIAEQLNDIQNEIQFVEVEICEGTSTNVVDVILLPVSSENRSASQL